jgi:hypothetical protein
VLARRFADTCESVADALALAAAHVMETERGALVDRRRLVASDAWDTSVDLPRAPAAGDPTSSFWPAPADEASPVTRGPRGGGGILALGGGALTSRGLSKTAHALAVVRVGKTRVGVSGAYQVTDDVGPTGGAATFGNTRGRRIDRAGRVGLVAGWGAPWNDFPVGFLVEAGGSYGTTSAEGESPPGYGGAFLGWSLVLTAPIAALPVRPVALLGAAVASAPARTGDAVFGWTGEAGFVWQAF